MTDILNYKTLFSKRGVVLFLLFIFSVRIVCAYFFGCEEPVGDGKSYHGYAMAILNGADWLTDHDFRYNYRAPIYPMFLALIYWIFGSEDVFAVYFFQAILSTLTVYYIFRLSGFLFGEKVSRPSLVWAGLYPYYNFYVGQILRETVIFFLMSFSFFHLCRFLLRGDDRHCLRGMELWSFMIGFTILLHTDPRYLFYIPFLLIVFVIYKNIWLGIKQYLWALCVFIVLLIPWSVRNYVVFNGIVLIDTRTLELRQDVARGYLMRLCRRKEKRTGCAKEYPSEEERGMVKKGYNPRDRSPNEIDAILNERYATRNEIKKRWYNFKALWRPYHFINEYRPWPDCRFDDKYSLSGFGLVKALSYGTLLPFMILAIAYVIIRKQKDAYVLVIPIVVQTLLHVLMWGIGRYRNPIDSFVIILGCNGMVVVYDFVRRKIEPVQKI